MLNKKIHSIILAGIMLISLLAVTTSVQAASPHSLKGVLYINDEIPTSPPYDFGQIMVKLVFTGESYKDTIYEYNSTSDNTNHNVGIFGHEGETADILVEYYGQEVIPDDNTTIFINATTYGYIIDLHINVTGIDIETPSKVTGLSVTDAKDGKLDLAWDAATDNIAVDHYNIYRDGTFLTTTTETTYQDTGLTNGQEYCYEISAVDTSSWEGEKSDEECATPTKTSTPSPPGPGPGPGPSPPPSGDDDDDTSTGDDDEVIPNNPPVIVNFTGNQTGSKNNVLSYSATATDPDGQDIKYTFGWDDGTDENTTDFMANGTQYNITHIFTAAGVYDIWVKVIDDYDNGNGTPSGKEYIQVLIDAHIIDNEDIDGYLTDDDGNGTYDTFHNNEDSSDSEVGTENGSYLLDTDGDGEYDYKYDPNTGLGETIEGTGDDEPSGDTEPAEEDNTLLYVGAALIIIILLILFLLATRKKNKK